ncbi:MAG TPA: outer membrane beta-barrel protein [Bacteroidota bacterium]
MLLVLPTVSLSQSMEESAYSTEGFMFNLHANYQPAYMLVNRHFPTPENYDTRRDIENSGGIGLGLQVGYAINPWVTFLGSFAFNAVSKEQAEGDRSVDVIYLELFTRLNLALPNARFIPYGIIGYGSRNISLAHYDDGGGNVIYVSDQEDFSGSVVSYGGGIYFGLGEVQNILDMSFIVSKGDIDGTQIPKTTTYRFTVGISFWILFD